MKKLMCLFLSLIIAVGLPCAAAAAVPQNEATGFAVATDLHYVHPMKSKEDFFLSDHFNTNENGHAFQHESGFIIDEFLRQCAENEDCSFVLIPGDLATYGRDSADEHIQLAAKFRRFESETGKQVYVINGNHDNGNTENDATDIEKFKEIYYEFGYDKAFSVDKSSCSYAVNLNDEYTLIALDSCDENYHLTSGITTDRLSWVRTQAKAATESGRSPILIMHHNLLEHQPLELLTQSKYIVTMPRTIATLFADWGIKLVFTGHTHTGDVTSFTSPAGNTIYDFCTGSLSEYPMQYRTVKLGSDSIDYDLKSIKHIDTAALSAVVSGYSTEELTAMATDFPAYAKGKFESQVKEVISNQISPEGLGISADSKLYSLVAESCDSVRTALQANLYGEDGIQELAAEYIEIPSSDYNTAMDVICKVSTDYVVGNKVYNAQSVEMQIVINTVLYALHDIAANATDTELLAVINSILGSDKGIAEYFDLTTIVERFALAILSPIIDAFFYDDDGVANLAGSIPAYGEAPSTLGNIQNTISFFVKLIINYFNKTLYLLNR